MNELDSSFVVVENDSSDHDPACTTVAAPLSFSAPERNNNFAEIERFICHDVTLQFLSVSSIGSLALLCSEASSLVKSSEKM